jgi:hypothetical protein
MHAAWLTYSHLLRVGIGERMFFGFRQSIFKIRRKGCLC